MPLRIVFRIYTKIIDAGEGILVSGRDIWHYRLSIAAVVKLNRNKKKKLKLFNLPTAIFYFTLKKYTFS